VYVGREMIVGACGSAAVRYLCPPLPRQRAIAVRLRRMAAGAGVVVCVAGVCKVVAGREGVERIRPRAAHVLPITTSETAGTSRHACRVQKEARRYPHQTAFM